MREQTCCFTGHRDIPEQSRTRIAAGLEKTVIELIQQGYRYFGAGGARGFDYEKKKIMRSEILEAAPESSR